MVRLCDHVGLNKNGDISVIQHMGHHKDMGHPMPPCYTTATSYKYSYIAPWIVFVFI